MKTIQLDKDTFDLKVTDGGLTVDDARAQNQCLLLNIHAGELRESPSLGAGIADGLLDENPLVLRRKIKEQLELDGQTVESVEISTGGIIVIKADYPDGENRRLNGI